MLPIGLFVAVVLTALILVPSGAHLLALVTKMKLDRGDYFVVQSIYRGWALSGIVVIAALAANIWAAWLLRGQGSPSWLSMAAVILVGATLAIFFSWTQPANAATHNWTLQPENWEQLRRRWEYSHAANAVLTFAALCCAVIAALTARA